MLISSAAILFRELCKYRGRGDLNVPSRILPTTGVTYQLNMKQNPAPWFTPTCILQTPT